LDNDTRFKFGPAPIQTPQDAVEAFLREEISEKELREALGRFGVNDPELLFGQNAPRPDRPDAAFHRDIPEDLLKAQPNPEWALDRRLKQVEEKEKLREEAAKASDKDKTVEETRKRESDQDWREELVEKHTLNPVTGEKAKVRASKTTTKAPSGAVGVKRTSK
jgi:hypothetical protein